MSESTTLRERMTAFYEEVTNLGPVALERLPALYRDDVCVYTPVEQRLGFEEFRDSWLHMFKAYKAFTFTDIQVMGDDFRFAFFCTMTVQLGFGSPAPMPIVTLFHADEHGKVFYQRDYWDTAASLAATYPPLRRAYQWAVGAFLGSGSFTAGDAGLPKPVGDDACYHPTSESELVELVKQASAERGTLRIVGSGDSVWESIVPDGFTKFVQLGQRLVMLDKYQAILRFAPDPNDDAQMLVEVQAGCTFGASQRLGRATARSPAAFANELTPNVTRERTWEQGLCHALHERGYALPDLGGVSRQTVGGFLSTGSAGGTCKWSILDAIESIRVIDGLGHVVTLHESGPDCDWFAAAGVGLGLCGVISTVTFKCQKTYDVVGRQTTSRTREAPDVDFYGDAHDDRPSLARFLLDTDYARLMWWPQRGFDRLVVWRAERAAPATQLEPKPYSERSRFAVGKQAAASLVYTILGNLETPERIGQHISQIQANHTGSDWSSAVRILISAIRESAPPPDSIYSFKLQERAPWLAATAESLLGRPLADTRADIWQRVVGTLESLLNNLVSGALSSKLLDPLAHLLAGAAPHVIDNILSAFVPLGPDGAPVVHEFQDVWYRGLPMDNAMDDLLVPTFFTEVWIPFSESGAEVDKAIAALRQLFNADGTVRGCYRATGPFAVEIYAAKAEGRFSLSPANGTQNVLRIDVFWFGYNAGDPVNQFFPQFWQALDGLDYRLHWGKFLPRADQLAPGKLLARFPGWDDFKRVRAERDPHDVFLTDYWRRHLGLPRA